MNIFIAGLNYNMSEAELGELFAEYGDCLLYTSDAADD